MVNPCRVDAVERVLSAVKCICSADGEDEDITLADALTELESAHRLISDELRLVTARRGRRFLDRARRATTESCEHCLGEADSVCSCGAGVCRHCKHTASTCEAIGARTETAQEQA